MPTMTYYSVQYLRAIAVLSVVLLHTQWMFSTELFSIPLVSDFGWIGVRLFFVISGFIIAERISHSKNLSTYLTRRYLRVFPLYMIFTLLTLLIYSKRGLGTTNTDSGMPFNAESNFYVLRSIFIIPQNNWPVFDVGWSLEFELIFYAIFGAAYFLTSPLFARIIIGSIALAGLSPLFSNDHVLHPYMFYFFAGITARDLYHRNRLISGIFASLALPVCTFIFIADLYQIIDISSEAFIVASSLAFASLILVALIIESYLPVSGMPSLAVRIGNASYAIYLCHWFFIGLATPYTRTLTLDQIWLEIIRILFVICSIFISIRVHSRIETPLNRISIHYATRFFLSSNSKTGTKRYS